MTAGVRALQVAFDQRRGEIDRAAATLGAVRGFNGFVELTGIGEATFDVAFPLVFSERPVFTHGSELADNQAIVAGKFPTCTLMVRRWERIQTPGSEAALYKAANMIAVVTGAEPPDIPASQITIAHFKFEGIALRNPIRDPGVA